jgi:hypothetical protein
MPAAKGPPKIITAIIGPAATETTVPRGRGTGSALARRVAAIQKASPIGPPRASWIGKRK